MIPFFICLGMLAIIAAIFRTPIPPQCPQCHQCHTNMLSCYETPERVMCEYGCRDCNCVFPVITEKE